MVHVRKLVLAIAAASALSSGMAHALGLGELTLRSAANQPLVAEIELLDVRDLSPADVKPGLAAADEFAKAGVTRPAFLNDLTFTPVINPGGRSVIRVTSSQPLTEPMVKFLVQVLWPNGRLLRDYSMLLDPARFSPQAAQAAQATPAVSAPTRNASPASYTTTPRDTLWEIAARGRAGGSVQQRMLAIQALNPDAFLEGNINRLKTGQVLRMPDAQQSSAMPQGEAIAEVARQNAAWREGRRLGPRAQQVDATRRAGAGTAAPVAPKDNLSLVSGTGTAAKGAAGDAQALSEKLAVTQESLDTARRDNEELKSRMGDLQSQLDKLQKIIQLKNDQLARLEAAATGTPASDAAAEAPLAGPAAESPESGDASAPSELDVLPPATQVQVVPAESAADGQNPPAGETNSVDKLLSSPAMLAFVGGAALLVVMLLLLLLARRRKAQQEAEKHMRMARALAEESEYRNEDHDLPESSFEGLERPSANVQLTPAMMAASAAAATAAAGPSRFAPAPPQTVIPTPGLTPSPDYDPIAEADRCIDHGRLNDAVDVLEAAIDKEPSRSDLRLKLMEVYGQQGDRDGFVFQERQLVANGQNHAEVETLKSRYPAMLGIAAATAGAAAVAAQMDADYVKSLLEDKPGAADPIDDAFDSGFDNDFDLSLDDPLDPIKHDNTSAFDNDLDFESLLAQAETEVKPADELSDFDLDIAADEPVKSTGDLEIDAQLAEFDQALDVAEKDPAPVPVDDLELPDDFDLSLAEEMDNTPPASAAPKSIDEVNGQLDSLSQSLGQAPIAEPFAAPGDEEDEFDYLSGTDEVTTKLDLARAYIEMGDNDGARDILDEVSKEGTAEQRGEAEDMLSRLV